MFGLFNSDKHFLDLESNLENIIFDYEDKKVIIGNNYHFLTDYNSKNFDDLIKIGFFYLSLDDSNSDISIFPPRGFGAIHHFLKYYLKTDGENSLNKLNILEVGAYPMLYDTYYNEDDSLLKRKIIKEVGNIESLQYTLSSFVSLISNTNVISNDIKELSDIKTYNSHKIVGNFLNDFHRDEIINKFSGKPDIIIGSLVYINDLETDCKKKKLYDNYSDDVDYNNLGNMMTIKSFELLKKGGYLIVANYGANSRRDKFLPEFLKDKKPIIQYHDLSISQKDYLSFNRKKYLDYSKLTSKDLTNNNLIIEIYKK
jgi:hypothetical protein